MDTVSLSDLRFETIVGILPAERVEPQPIVLDVELGLALGPIGESGDLGLGIDYAAVETQLTALTQLGRFWLIESLGLAAVRWLLLEPTADEARGRIERARIAIRKPAILGGRAVPGVAIARSVPARVTVESQDGVERVTLVQTPRDGAWRLRLEPGAHWQLEPWQGALVVAGDVLVGGQRYDAGTRVPSGAELASSHGATLLAAGSYGGTAPNA